MKLDRNPEMSEVLCTRSGALMPQQDKQDFFIEYFNDKNVGMISMPDLYLAGKSGDEHLYRSLRLDMENTFIVTKFELFVLLTIETLNIVDPLTTRSISCLASPCVVYVLLRESVRLDISNGKKESP